MNKMLLKTITILVIFFAYCILSGCHFIEAQQPISNPIEEPHTMEVAGGIFSYIFSFGLAFLIPVVFFFLFHYFFIWSGLKILKIKGITKAKILLYVFAMFLSTSFLQGIINNITASLPVFYLSNAFVSFLLVFVIFKYYFLLSGKKLWYLSLYVVVLSIILNLTLRFLFL